MDFSGLFVTLGSASYPTLAAAKAAGAPTLNYGLFINTLVDFVIVAFALFLVIKAMNRLKKEEAAPAKAPDAKKYPECLSENSTRGQTSPVRHPSCQPSLNATAGEKP